MRLIVVETHPIQYRTPIFRALVDNGVNLTVLYGSDCSVAGYVDPGFAQSFAWDQDLLSGYSHRFMGTTATGADSPAHASSNGLADHIRELRPTAIMASGYSPQFHRDAMHAAV